MKTSCNAIVQSVVQEVLQAQMSTALGAGKGERLGYYNYWWA